MTNPANSAPLFKYDQKTLEVPIEIHSKNETYEYLDLSDQLKKIFEIKVSEVLNNDNSEGLIYFLYQKNHQDIIPLYIGIANKTGKSNKTSSLFLKKEKSRPRWDYTKNGNFHLSDINTLLLNKGYNESERQKAKGKSTWLKSIFANSKTPIKNGELPKLNYEIFLSVDEWNAKSVSSIPNLGHTSLYCEEAILIDCFTEFYANSLLNKIH